MADKMGAYFSIGAFRVSENEDGRIRQSIIQSDYNHCA